MTLKELKDKIEARKARLAVIGLGYVGLAVACEFARAGFDVVGVELKCDRVEKINSGITPIEGNEPRLAELLSEVVRSGKLRASTNYGELRDRDVVLIDVETPVDEANIPRYEALRAALRSLGPVLKQDALVIVESTTAPGTMLEVVYPLLEQSSGRSVNSGFFLGNCPERVMPGKLLANLRQVSRVVGGMTLETAETMVAIYRHVVQADLDPTDCITAELVKTVENAYRDVQIAFANEVALICEQLGGNVWTVRNLVNKSPFRQMHFPGAGVGGHCIPKDSWLLAYSVKDLPEPLRLIPAARAVNESMPIHMANLVQQALQSVGSSVAGARVLVLGYSYLENSDDTRNSPSEKLVQQLRVMEAEPIIHDPYVPGYQEDVAKLATGCDVAVLMVKHHAYRDLPLKDLKNWLRTPILVDGRGLFDANQARKIGFIYLGVGVNSIP